MKKLNNCPICQNFGIYTYKKINQWQLSKCKSCKVVFLNPQPSSNELQTYYDVNYFNDVAYPNQDLNLDDFIKIVAYNLARFEKRFGKIKSILEIGCGYGHFLASAKKLGYDCDGIEISTDACKYAKENFGVEISNCDLENFTINKKYDLIYLSHSLEHLPNPTRTCNQIHDLLSKSGKAWIIVPNISSIERYIEGNNWDAWSLPYHLFHFNKSSITYLLRNCGFNKIYTEKSFYRPSNIFSHLLSTFSNSTSTEKNLSAEELIKEVKKFSKLKSILRTPLTKLLPGKNLTVVAFK
ncbi:MAG: class I SAM-dependent methyltransferase [Ignavibacteria bacterium]|nr:class I SAM-dependent methyltransferase [Ignavibacteria bacterium]